MELRLVLAHMVYNFDMELQSDSRDWAQGQKNLFIVWDKPSFNVRLRPVGQQPKASINMISVGRYLH